MWEVSKSYLQKNLPYIRKVVINGGAKEDRTPDLLIANQSLSQLSYSPMKQNRLNGRS